MLSSNDLAWRFLGNFFDKCSTRREQLCWNHFNYGIFSHSGLALALDVNQFAIFETRIHTIVLDSNREHVTRHKSWRARLEADDLAIQFEVTIVAAYSDAQFLDISRTGKGVKSRRPMN